MCSASQVLGDGREHVTKTPFEGAGYLGKDRKLSPASGAPRTQTSGRPRPSSVEVPGPCRSAGSCSPLTPSPRAVRGQLRSEDSLPRTLERAVMEPGRVKGRFHPRGQSLRQTELKPTLESAELL